MEIEAVVDLILVEEYSPDKSTWLKQEVSSKKKKAH